MLSGGELAAMVIIDAVSRFLPGVLGDDFSTDFESFEIDGILDFPQYTRPRIYNEMHVPDVLFSGNHEEVAKWRFEQSIKRTKERRPDINFNEKAVFDKFSQLPCLQRERKKLKSRPLNNKKNAKNKNSGENNESAHR